MRISTVTMFEQSVTSMNRQQGEFMKVGQQIASGRRVVNPSDDPQAASRAVRTSQALGLTQQYADARVSARNSLSQQESILNSVSDSLGRAKTLMVQVANGTLSNADRDAVASELRGLYETVIGQANATDGNGRYLFGGYQDSSEPFVRAGDGSVNYVGDGNTRQQRIDASRLMPVADNGQSIFQSVHSGAGYMAEADPANAGSVTFTGPRLVDASDPAFGNAFHIDFQVLGVNTTYSINGGPAQPYGEGAPLQFGGLSLTLNGVPANGDSITIDRAVNMNTNVFRTFEKALAALENPAVTEAEHAALRNSINTVMREFDNSLDNVLTTRASVGARLNELDMLDLVGDGRKLNYESTLSDLVDLDYVEAISQYTLRQVGLQAAQKAFVDIKGLSLFNFL